MNTQSGCAWVGVELEDGRFGWGPCAEERHEGVVLRGRLGGIERGAGTVDALRRGEAGRDAAGQEHHAGHRRGFELEIRRLVHRARGYERATETTTPRESSHEGHQ